MQAQEIYEKLAALSEKATKVCAELEAYEKEVYEKIPEEDREYADSRLDTLAIFLDNAVCQYAWIKEAIIDGME